MGKMQALPLATAAQKGVANVGTGLKVPAAGVVDALRPSADLWVDSAGNDTEGSGSEENPFATLTRAFAFITGAPLPNGYTVHLPSGQWEENVGLPPPATRLVGEGDLTSLAGVGGAALAWVEGVTDPGARYVDSMRLTADITGRDGGNLALHFDHVALVGVLTLVGAVSLDGCNLDAVTFVNCANVLVHDPMSSPSSAFDLSYDPGAGTNGPGAAYNEISGGLWGGITYDSQDATVPLYVLGARVLGGLFASHSGHIEASGTVAAALSSNDSTSEIAYDGPVNDASPTFHGLGIFRNAELVLKRAIPLNFGSGDVTIPVPPQATATLKNVFAMADIAGVSVNWVSSTFNSITLHITAPVAHPAYELRILVKP